MCPAKLCHSIITLEPGFLSPFGYACLWSYLFLEEYGEYYHRIFLLTILISNSFYRMKKILQ